MVPANHAVEVLLRPLLGLTDGHEALDHEVRPGKLVPVLLAYAEVVFEPLSMLLQVAEVAHDAPAVAGRDRHAFEAGATEPDRQRVLQRSGGDRRRPGHLHELAVERE